MTTERKRDEKAQEQQSLESVFNNIREISLSGDEPISPGYRFAYAFDFYRPLVLDLNSCLPKKTETTQQLYLHRQHQFPEPIEWRASFDFEAVKTGFVSFKMYFTDMGFSQSSIQYGFYNRPFSPSESEHCMYHLLSMVRQFHVMGAKFHEKLEDGIISELILLNPETMFRKINADSSLKKFSIFSLSEVKKSVFLAEPGLEEESDCSSAICDLKTIPGWSF